MVERLREIERKMSGVRLRATMEIEETLLREKNIKMP